MRNFWVTVYFLFASECYGGNYWVQYFIECSSITDDDISCFNDIAPQIRLAVKKETSFDPKQCTKSLEESKRILSTINLENEGLESAMVLVGHKDNLGSYACMSSRVKGIKTLVSILDRKLTSLENATKKKDPDLCEDLYSLVSVVSMRAQLLIQDGRKCIKRAHTASIP